VTNSDSFHQLVKLGFHTNAWDIQEYLKFMQMNDSNDAPPDVGSILCFGHLMILQALYDQSLRSLLSEAFVRPSKAQLIAETSGAG